MTLSTAPFRSFVQDKIYETTPGYPAFIGKVPEDHEVNAKDGLFTPHYMVFYGGPIRAGRGDRSLVSTRKDGTIVYANIICVAPRADIALEMKDGILDALLGGRPDDFGEIVLDGGFGYSRGSNTVRPTRYEETLIVSARGNLKVV